MNPEGELDPGASPPEPPIFSFLPLLPLIAEDSILESAFHGSRDQRSQSGCSAAWLAHLHGVQGVGGSNPLTQISFPSHRFSD